MTDAQRRPESGGQPAPTAARRGRRSWWSRVLAVVGIVVTVYVTVRNPEDLEVLTDADPALIAVTTVLQVLLLGATALTHRYVIHEVSGATIGVGPWTRLFVMARFLNNVVPQGGNAYRAARLRTEWGVSLTAYLSAYAAFMWLLTSYNFVLATIVVLTSGQSFDIVGVPAPLLLATAAVGVILGPLLVNALWQRIPVLEGRIGWIHERVEVFLNSSVTAFSRPPVLVQGALLATTSAALATGVTWAAFHAFGHRLSLAEVLVFYVIIQVSSFIQVTPGNIGLQELAFGLLANEYGIPVASGVLVSALIRMTGLVALFVIAVPMGGLGVARRWRARAGRDEPV